MANFSDLDAVVDPLVDELRALDAQLSTTVRVSDLGWVVGKPVLRVGPLNESTAAQLASTTAEPVEA